MFFSEFANLSDEIRVFFSVSLSFSLEAEQSSSPRQPAAGSDCDDCHIATMGNVKDLSLLKNTGRFFHVFLWAFLSMHFKTFQN